MSAQATTVGLASAFTRAASAPVSVLASALRDAVKSASGPAYRALIQSSRSGTERRRGGYGWEMVMVKFSGASSAPTSYTTTQCRPWMIEPLSATALRTVKLFC